ncbi:SSD domain-containing protein, partial [Trichostrongylus colubriformis]
IGIDDSFLMLAAWHETPRHLKVEDRIGLSMRHAAVSISITTLTDALAFLIGAIAPLPADSRMWYQKFFEDYYAPFIANRWTVLVVITMFGTYVTAATIGSQRVVVGFDLINIVLTNSRPRHFLEIRKQYFPEDITRMDIAVMKPPRMAIATEREPFMRLLEKFESTACSAGRNSTEFWYFAFEKYMGELGFVDAWKNIVDDEEGFSDNLRGFLMANDKYSYDVLRYANGTPKAFRFATRLRGVATDELIDRCAQLMRKLCDDNPQYALSTYTPLWNLADQYEIMWPQTLQDLYISIAVMLGVALLFIPQPLCAPLVGLSIASVALGVLGIMPFLGVNLDATSMITIAMSVGFSVDFAAHVSYAFMTQKISDCDEKNAPFSRLRSTLGTVGWPITQASMSVLLGISSLSFVDSYVVQTCFKTVILVITFGTIHALVFLPLVLMFSHKVHLWLAGISQRRRSSNKIRPRKELENGNK